MCVAEGRACVSDRVDWSDEENRGSNLLAVDDHGNDNVLAACGREAQGQLVAS